MTEEEIDVEVIKINGMLNSLKKALRTCIYNIQNGWCDQATCEDFKYFNDTVRGIKKELEYAEKIKKEIEKIEQT